MPTATQTEPSIDSAVLDVLADDRVVAAVATIVDRERKILAAQIASRDLPGNDNAGRSIQGSIIFFARNDQRDAYENMTERIGRLVLEIVRAEREQA